MIALCVPASNRLNDRLQTMRTMQLPSCRVPECTIEERTSVRAVLAVTVLTEEYTLVAWRYHERSAMSISSHLLTLVWCIDTDTQSVGARAFHPPALSSVNRRERV